MADHGTVLGVFAERSTAERALADLQQAGFDDDRIGFLVPRSAADVKLDNQEVEGVVPVATLDTGRQGGEWVVAPPTAPGVGVTGYAPGTTPGTNLNSLPNAVPVPGHPDIDETPEELKSSKTEETLKGAAAGGTVGGILGAAAALLIPGIGPVLAGGILAATLGGAAIGAVAGGVAKAFTGLGLTHTEAEFYQNEFAAGHIILVVKAGERSQDAQSILRQNGAYDAETHPATTTTTIEDVEEHY